MHGEAWQGQIAVPCIFALGFSKPITLAMAKLLDMCHA